VPWAEATSGASRELPDGVASALILNLLTEDNLPLYVAALYERLGDVSPWGAWIRRWTAEEMRHATVLRDYLTVTGAVDLVALEDARFEHVARGPVPTAPNALEALVYVALQELATRVAHANTGRALPDRAGQVIMRRVAADEQLHHAFYRDAVAAALERHPDATVIAIEAQARHFTMPGVGMAGFEQHAQAIAAAGIYSLADLHRQVLSPVLLEQWRLAGLTGLSPEAESARRRTVAFLDRIGRLATRLNAEPDTLGATTSARPVGAPAPGDSW
jgi:acyl-[acyl-carrier-protein] desaturase